MVVEWTPEQIAETIRAEIDAYEKLKAQLTFASGAEARRIELQMISRLATIFHRSVPGTGARMGLKEELEKLGRADLWEQFKDWEKSLS